MLRLPRWAVRDDSAGAFGGYFGGEVRTGSSIADAAPQADPPSARLALTAAASHPRDIVFASRLCPVPAALAIVVACLRACGP